MGGGARAIKHNESPGDGLNTGAGALAGVSVLTQKGGGSGNFEITLFTYIVNCRAKTKDFCKPFLWALQTHPSLKKAQHK